MKFDREFLTNVLQGSFTKPSNVEVVNRTAQYGGVFDAVFHVDDDPTLYRVTGQWSNLDNSFSFMHADGMFEERSDHMSPYIECREVEPVEVSTIEYHYKHPYGGYK